jgi:ABC-type multidrug transport system, ATPase component
MNIELDNVSKNFKNQTVLENVNLKLESGKYMVLLEETVVEKVFY